LNQAVLVSDAQRVEKRTHHRPLRGQMIDDEHASGDRFRQAWEARQMAGFSIQIERDDALGSELLALRDEHHGLDLILGGVRVAPEGLGRSKPLRRSHVLPQSGWRKRRVQHAIRLLQGRGLPLASLNGSGRALNDY
jgi:hypothetical protein